MIHLGEDFYKEEVRCGFKVTEKRKKCWAVVLNLLHEFDLFCKKYSLRYFVGYGTLLGAVRHKGFIPWDDDIDIIMTRDEYMKMGKYAREYFDGKEIGGRKLVFEDAYSDNTVFKSYFSKLRDCETTIASPDMRRNRVWAGIWMDIFPIDATNDGSDSMIKKTLIRNELWLSWVHGSKGIDAVLKAIEYKSVLGEDVLKHICALPPNQRMEVFEAYTLSMWGKSAMVGDYFYYMKYMGKKDTKLSLWQEVVELPFEHLMVPAPAGWDGILKAWYGDYHEFVMGGSCHEGTFHDTDTPFVEYKAGRKRIPADWDGSL